MDKAMSQELTSESYVSQKKDILDRCLRLTEEIYSCLEKQEDPDKPIQERMTVIHELESLESSANDDIKNTCPRDEAVRMDEKLKLILSLDKQIEQSIKKTQKDILESMKQNIQEQKFTLYDTPDSPENGYYFDKKQ